MGRTCTEPRRRHWSGDGRLRQRGAAAVEFFLVAMLAVIPLAMAILQLGVLVAAKHAVDHAAFLAARAGATTHGDRGEMLRHLALGLAALHVRVPLDAGNDGWQPDGVDVARAVLAAWAEVKDPRAVRLDVLNPTVESFAAFEVQRWGVREIPNEALDRAGLVRNAAGQTLREANVLKIRVTRCHPLIFPLIDRLVVGLLRRMDPDPFAQLCYARGGVVLRSQALSPMHSTPRREALGL